MWRDMTWLTSKEQWVRLIWTSFYLLALQNKRLPDRRWAGLLAVGLVSNISWLDVSCVVALPWRLADCTFRWNEIESALLWWHNLYNWLLIQIGKLCWSSRFDVGIMFCFIAVWDKLGGWRLQNKWTLCKWVLFSWSTCNTEWPVAMDSEIAGLYWDGNFVFSHPSLPKLNPETCNYHLWPQRLLLPLLSKR